MDAYGIEYLALEMYRWLKYDEFPDYCRDKIKLEEKIIYENGKPILAASKTLMQLTSIAYILWMTGKFYLGFGAHSGFEATNIFVRDGRIILEPILYRYYDIKNLYEKLYNGRNHKVFDAFGNEWMYKKFTVENFLSVFRIENFSSLDEAEQYFIKTYCHKIFEQKSDIYLNECSMYDCSDFPITDYEKRLYDRELEIARTGKYIEAEDFNKKLGLYDIYDIYTNFVYNPPLTDFTSAMGVSTIKTIDGKNFGNLLTASRSRQFYNRGLETFFPIYNRKESDAMAIQYCMIPGYDLMPDGSSYSPLAPDNYKECFFVGSANNTKSVYFGTDGVVQPFIRNANYIVMPLISKNLITNGDTFANTVIQLGQFPQDVADLLTIDKLDYELEKDKLLKIADSFKYSYTYTTISVLDKTGEINKMVCLESPVYLYEGEKYIRVKNENFTPQIYSNGQKYKRDDWMWIKFSPVNWRLLPNLREYGYYHPSLIRDIEGLRGSNEILFSLYTEKAILGGIRPTIMSAYDDKKFPCQLHHYFPYTDMYDFMDKYMEKEMFEYPLNDSRLIDTAQVKRIRIK